MQKSLGMMIAELRKSHGMTQLELAEKMGVTDKAVSKWERDLSCPDISSLPNLAEILGVSVDELMQNSVETDSKPQKCGKMLSFIPQNISCSYIIFLIVISVLLILSAITTVQVIPYLQIHINFSNIINFLDFFGIFFVLAVCLVTLICTKSVKPLKNSFIFMFRKLEYTTVQYEDCLLAVRTVIFSAFAGGGIMFLTSCVNILKGMDLSNNSAEFSCGLLSLIYAFVIAFILLPVYISLKRGLAKKFRPEATRHIKQ